MIIYYKLTNLRGVSTYGKIGAEYGFKLNLNIEGNNYVISFSYPEYDIPIPKLHDIIKKRYDVYDYNLEKFPPRLKRS